MRRRLAAALFALAAATAPAPRAAGQSLTTDLSMRRALYFTGVKADALDTKNDPYVTEGGTLTLRKSQAAKCEAGGCYFNFGFVALRAPK